MANTISRIVFQCSVLLVLANIVLAGQQACRSPVVRKEWRSLSKASQLMYITAVKCLQALPPKYAADWPGARNRFDDFQGLHINQTDFIHFVGHFQPWHRWFVATYEQALCGECGYCDGQPYWDWTMDATVTSFPNAPVFDPFFGFGGNGPYVNKTNPSLPFEIDGKTGGGCVEDGPFKTMSVNMGPGNSTAYNPRCLTRDFDPTLAAAQLNQGNVKATLQAQSFSEFDIKVQGGPTPAGFTYHAGGHIGVGGELGVMTDVYASPGDPLFFLHHANMDRIWWTWEASDRKTRTQDITGPSEQFAAPFDFFGPKVSPNITLDFVMNVRDFVPGGVKVGDVMDIQKGVLCYDYDELAN